MHHVFKFLFVCISTLILCVSCTNAKPQPSDLQKLADSYADVRGFNGSVIVASGTDILVKSSYGEADIEWGIPNSPTTRYRIGSLTKPMTGTLILALVEDGSLSLTGTLGEYVPELYADTAAANVTVEQLLSHTSAMPDFPRDLNGDWYKTTGRLSFKPKDFAREWIKPELTGTPGEAFRYNNAGFVLLGIIIEEVTGRTYAENLKEKVFDPAGMTSSGIFTQGEIIPNMARGYERLSEGGLKHATPVDPSIFMAAGDIYSTLEDLHRFDRALTGNKLLSKDMRVAMMTPQSDTPYGFGWSIEGLRINSDLVLRFPGHSGSIPGYQSYYLRSENNEGFVFVTSNTNQGSIVPVMARDLMKVLNGKPMSLAKLNLLEFLAPILERDGEQAMIDAYKGLGDNLSDYDASESVLNSLGYRLLRLEKTDAALVIFESNVTRNPNAANPHDSLGETYRAVGRVEDAIKSYEKALTLDPESKSAKAALAEMRETGK